MPLRWFDAGAALLRKAIYLITYVGEEVWNGRARFASGGITPC